MLYHIAYLQYTDTNLPICCILPEISSKIINNSNNKNASTYTQIHLNKNKKKNHLTFFFFFLIFSQKVLCQNPKFY